VGSYAIWKLAPEARVFIDGRFETVYPKPVIDDYFAFMHGSEGWERSARRLSDGGRRRAALARHPSAALRAIGSRLRLLRSRVAVFVRPTPTNQAALDRLALLSDRSAFARAETVFP
jgi:hypothetical protein